MSRKDKILSEIMISYPECSPTQIGTVFSYLWAKQTYRMNTIKKSWSLVLVLLLSTFGVFAQNAKTATSGTISFFSSTPVEDIDAYTNNVLSKVDFTKKTMAFVIQNNSFQFKNKLMQEHFNEKYMESDKYPQSSFVGIISGDYDIAKDGEYKVSVTGKLKIHGVEQERTIPGSIVVKEGKIVLKSAFKVKVADHKIEIPKLVTSKIAEEIDVKVEATF
jgi:polyisoprenoid-binding protein YceI